MLFPQHTELVLEMFLFFRSGQLVGIMISVSLSMETLLQTGRVWG